MNLIDNNLKKYATTKLVEIASNTYIKYVPIVKMLI